MGLAEQVNGQDRYRDDLMRDPMPAITTPGVGKARRRERGKHLLFRYSVLMFGAVALVSIGMAWGLSRLVRNHLVQMHGSVYGDIVKTVLASRSLEDGRRLTNEDIHKLEVIAGLPHMLGVAVWNRAGKEIYKSGAPPDYRMGDSAMKRALSGAPAYAMAAPKGANSEDYSFFVPIPGGEGRVSGIFAAKEADSQFQDDLSRADISIFIVVGVAGLLLYVALFGLYYDAYRRQNLTASRLSQTHDSVIFAMSSLSNLRDQETGGHLERTAEYVRILASRLRRHPVFSEYIDDEYVDTLSKVAPLHDIGKVGISDSILKKPGKLEREEFEEMKRHSALGADLLHIARIKLPFSSSLELAEEITRHHHERWDGSGYPDGLSGEAIPLSARIMAIADVYDALRSERRYKPGSSHDEAMAAIERGSASHFDPRIVGVLRDIHPLFSAVYASTPF